MQLNDFKLKTVLVSIGYKSELKIKKTEIYEHGVFEIKMHRIHGVCFGVPLCFTYATNKYQEELNIKDLKESIKRAEAEIKEIKDLPYSEKHRDYIIATCYSIWGNDFTEIERLHKEITTRLIKKYLKKIEKQKGNDFKKVYGEFIKNFDLKILKENQKKEIDILTKDIDKWYKNETE